MMYFQDRAWELLHENKCGEYLFFGKVSGCGLFGNVGTSVGIWEWFLGRLATLLGLKSGQLIEMAI